LKAIPLVRSSIGGAAAPPLVRQLAPQTKKEANRLANYTLGLKLGQGARGAVYAATRFDMPDAAFAVKFVPSQYYDGEDALLMSLNHPNVLPILESFRIPRRDGKPGEELCYVLPLCSNGDLCCYCANFEGGVLTEEAFWRALLLLATGLDYLHSKNIIHSDIKPQNILLHGVDDMMLADFGTAREHVGAEGVGEIVGTIAYMSPETFESFTVSEQADMWSLGATFFTALSGPGKCVFGIKDGNAERAAAAKIVKSGGRWVPPELPPGPHLSDELRSIVRQMLDYDPALRPTPSQLLLRPLVREARVRADAFANPAAPTTALGLARAQTVANALAQCGWSSSPLSHRELDDLATAFKLLSSLSARSQELVRARKLPLGHMPRSAFCHVLNAASLRGLLSDDLLNVLEVGHHTGVVSWQDFVAGVAALETRSGGDHEGHLVAAFRAFGSDGAGKLTRTELEDFFIAVGLEPPEGFSTLPDTSLFVSSVFRAIDKDGSGTLSMEEFQLLVANSKPCSVCSKIQTLSEYAEHFAECKARVFRERAVELNVDARVAALFEPVSHVDGKRREVAPPSDNATLIVDRLFLGNQWSATGDAFIKANKIRAIVNVARSEAHTLSEEERAALGVDEVRSEDVFDVVDVDASEQLARAADAVHELLTRRDDASGNVLVHCVQGISRSAATVIAYFVRHRGMTLVEAAALVRGKRFVSYPNLSFWKSLRTFELEKRGVTTVPEAALQLHGTVVLLGDRAAEAVAAAGTPLAKSGSLPEPTGARLQRYVSHMQ
jgi:serine/threonine protein kinase/protein-tyrosine phosphatase